ncbi:MAG: EFR1 family ferrodoxin [Bacteroidetes bacterium]|nr:EFR1 family ferrodoxin [Bacteroidota bacterium]
MDNSVQDAKSIKIYYFTGTGNAKKAAEWLKDSFAIDGQEAELYNMASRLSIEDMNVGESTLLGFCYPTHGFNAPPIVLRFLWQLPKTNNKTKVFLLNTRAGMKMSKIFTPGINGLALILPAIILRMKAYRVVGYRPLDMPSNWISVHPGLRQKVVKSIVKRCKYMTMRFADKLKAGVQVNRGLYDLPIDILISPIAMGYYFYGRFMLSKTFIATDACNECRICEKECPVDAISMKNGMPYWSYNCESCMHCMNACPQRAIETPHAYTALVWWLAFSLLPLLILKYAFQVSAFTEIQHEAIQKLLQFVLGGLIIFGAYKVLHTLMKFKAFNKLVAYTSLTHYKSWRRYKGPDVK